MHLSDWSKLNQTLSVCIDIPAYYDYDVLAVSLPCRPSSSMLTTVYVHVILEAIHTGVDLGLVLRLESTDLG